MPDSSRDISSVGLGITQKAHLPKKVQHCVRRGSLQYIRQTGRIRTVIMFRRGVSVRQVAAAVARGQQLFPHTVQAFQNRHAPSSALLCSRQRSCKAGRAAADDDDLSVFAHNVSPFPHANRGFTWFNVLKALCASTGACALHTCSRASGGLEVIIPHPPAGFIRSFSNHLTNFVSTCYNKAMATAGCRNGTPSWWPRARTFVRMKSEGGPVPASLFLRRTQL